MNHLEEFTSASLRAPTTRQTTVEHTQQWSPLSVNVIKINFDARVQKRSILGAIAAIARDHLACRDLVILARNHGFINIIVDGDSLSMIQATKGNHSPSNIQGIIHDIQGVAMGFLSADFSFVRRQANNAAHFIASIALKDLNFLSNPLYQFHLL
uniref:RNase H type-1 domain-containing protein n=1 Tax=Manihot esculenta TaxID=3983 RepID=A0A2C9VL74_MANES